MQIMKSWMCNSQGKGLGLPEGIIPCTDGLTRIKDTPTRWELEYSCNNDNTVLISSQDATENLRYIESLAGDTQKIFSESIGELFDRSIVQGQVTTSASHSFSQKAASGEEETGSKNSSSVIDSDTRESSIIDLKLGRFADGRSSNKCKLIRDAETFTSLASPIPAKRIRPTGLNGQTSFCQVLDCNMDLSDSKDYYKRHKVCEIHSKTAKVIVNGKQQRFCQQCSRFHLLDAFDDGKRSCRKRLAGHNERRRKPQIDILPSRTGRVIQPYHGLAFLGTTSSGSTSFGSPDMFPCGILQEVNNENTNWQRRAQSREGTLSSDAPPPTTVNGQLFPRSLNPSYGTQKHFSSNVGNVMSESIHYDYGNRYELGFGASNLVFDNESHNKGFPEVSVSTRAHSLLSSQSQRSYLYPREVPVSAQPLLFQDGNVHYSKEPFLDKALAVGLQASTSVASGSCYSSRMNSVQDHQMSLLASYSNTAEDFDIQRCGNFQGPRVIDTKDQLSHESGHTITLLQLSLLQNAEERGKSVQVKQESDSFKSLPKL